MRILLLSSVGVRFPVPRRELLKLLNKDPKNTRVTHIITASNVVKDKSYVDGDRSVFKELGFQIKEVDIAGKSEKQLRKMFQDTDVLYVQGGNGFYLLREVRKSGFDTVVKELINKGVLYMGVSAGTYICCPTIEMHTWKRVKDNNFGLTDLTAMNLVPFLISVHYNRDKYREMIQHGMATTMYPVKILTDNQALLIQDETVTLVGEGEEIKI